MTRTLSMRLPSVSCLVGLALFAATGCQQTRHRVEPARLVRQTFLVMRATHNIQPKAVPDVHFRDVADASGIRYSWQIGGSRPTTILQTIGNGCAFLDYDNDGNLDVLLVGPAPALYHGDGHGHFTDASHEAGIDRLSGHFLGVAVGDYDGDGYDDLYLSGYRTGVLLHNEALIRGQQRVVGRTARWFRDVTAEAGLKPQPWGTSCAFAETVPGSRRLDLYVGNYVDFGPDTDPQLCDEHGELSSCGPLSYKPIRGVFYRNLGNGRFIDATVESGMNAATGKALGVLFADLAGQGRPSLYLANDETAGNLLQPSGGNAAPTYRDVAVSSGAAFDRDGNIHGGMGVDCGDYNNDGALDLLIATFQNEPRSLYRNQGRGLFFDVGMMSGFGGETAASVAFGCKFFDFNNDGNLDIVFTNGHIQDNVHDKHPQSVYRQPTQLFRGSGGANPSFENISASSPDLMRPIVGRGLAIGDFDNDGRIDLLVADAEGKPLLLHNECSPVGHWLGVSLIGVKCNRDGYGARLTAQIGTRNLLRYAHADGSYLSSSDKRVHFGLGRATQVDRLTLLWPDGHSDIYIHLPADRYISLREGDSTPQPGKM